MGERGKPRPGLFRALGKDDPPLTIQVDGETFVRVEILKHDSWAATATYQSPTKKIVCKFNRQQSVLGLPMGWLGRWLARREAEHYRRLADLPNVPPLCGPVSVDALPLPFAVAHDYVEGRPLRSKDVLPDSFIAELHETFQEVHRRNMAYIDLHKRENILVGEDGRPHLIDFQVSWMLGEKPGLFGFFKRWLLRQLQNIDCYHLRKHEYRLLCNRTGTPTASVRRPWWIRLHRLVAVPLRELRRRLLVLVGVRRAKGRSDSEHFAEDAVRQESKHAA